MGIAVNDREIAEAMIYPIDARASLIHEFDKAGNHRLRITDRKYRVGSPNRHPIGEWTQYDEIATVIDGGSHGRQFAGVSEYRSDLPPVFLVHELPEGEPL